MTNNSNSTTDNDKDNSSPSSSSSSLSSPSPHQKRISLRPSLLIVIVAYLATYFTLVTNTVAAGTAATTNTEEKQQHKQQQQQQPILIPNSDDEEEKKIEMEKECIIDENVDDAACISTETKSQPTKEGEKRGETEKTEDEEEDDEDEETPMEENAIYAIGDLHGDITCARKWVQRTSLISNLKNNENDPSRWKWKDKTSKLIFVGDYIDKGPYSLQVVQFVKQLTDAFPEHVVAIMGNHELELLKDRVGKEGSLYYQLPYATVHPAEYLNFLPNEKDHTEEEDVPDEVIIDLLYNASIEVYSQDDTLQSTIFAPSVPPHLPSHIKSIVDYVYPETFQPIVAKKLASYQREYLNSFRSNTTLGKWVESRPIFHLEEEYGTLFVHGGISTAVSTHLRSGTKDISRINTLFRENAKEDSIVNFLGKTLEGQIIEHSVFFRGNHLNYGGSCRVLDYILEQMEGVERIAVGHTPGFDVRVDCDGRFLALDSMLGRWIRGSGNMYCPMEGNHEEEEKEEKEGALMPPPRRSLNGKFECERIYRDCEGEIVRISKGGTIVEVIDDL